MPDHRPPDLIAGFWTLSGDTGPFSVPRVCAVPLEDRIRAAADAGFTGIGFGHDDLMHWLGAHGRAPLMKCLADHGIALVELELIVDWFAEGERRAVSDRVRADLLAVAADIGARHIKVVGDRNRDAHWSTDRLIEQFSRLCDEARAAGTRIALEFQPWSSVHDLETAMPIVSGAAHPCGGLMLDIWHVDRGGVRFADIAQLPRGAITAVELSDARKAVQGTLWEDTSNRRLLCGEGELDVAAFVIALEAAAYRGPFSVEIISEAHRARSLREQARSAYESTMRMLVSARAMEHPD